MKRMKGRVDKIKKKNTTNKQIKILTVITENKYKLRVVDYVKILAVLFGVSVLDLFDDRVEAGVLVGGVLDNPLGTVGFYDGVLTLDFVAVAGLPLGLDVVGVEVVDGVVVVVFCWGLKQRHVSILRSVNCYNIVVQNGLLQTKYLAGPLMASSTVRF